MSCSRVKSSTRRIAAGFGTGAAATATDVESAMGRLRFGAREEPRVWTAARMRGTSPGDQAGTPQRGPGAWTHVQSIARGGRDARPAKLSHDVPADRLHLPR